MSKIISLDKAITLRNKFRTESKKVVMTNGCFDLLHRGHIELLTEARSLGDILFVAVNSNQSIKELKGLGRPFIDEEDRIFMLSALSCVDYVLLFDELTPIGIISKLIPDILTKGSDWKVNEIVGRDVVESSGGQVIVINRPMVNDGSPKYSTTKILQKIKPLLINNSAFTNELSGLNIKNDLVLHRFIESIETTKETAKNISEKINQSANIIVSSLQKNQKILVCGNGGSASQSEHFVAELVCKFNKYRNPLAAISLTTNTSNLTAIANDINYESIFSRQVEAIGSKHDILIAISTKGESKNIINALKVARESGLITIGLLGCSGGKMKELVDFPIIVPSNNIARIQEIHITIGHIIVEIIEEAIFN